MPDTHCLATPLLFLPFSLLLSCHRPARSPHLAGHKHRLYESWGFQPTPWVDPVWQEDAEKGRAVRQRRIMLVKPLSGPGLTKSPLGSLV